MQCGMICDTEDLVCVMAVLTAVGCHRVGLVHNDDEVNYVLGIILMGDYERNINIYQMV